MSSPPSYADLGKSARDLFSKGFSMQLLLIFLEYVMLKYIFLSIILTNFII